MLKRIFAIIKKDFILEWRQKYSIYGLILYLCSSIMIIKMLEAKPESVTWNILFWLILIFLSVNAVAKSFLQESKGRNLYYYTLHDGKEVILAKLIYNIALMVVLSILSWLLFFVFLGNPILDLGKYFLVLVAGGISLSSLFTLLSGIAGKAGGNSALIAILGFPLVIPQLILISDLTRPLIEELQTSGWWTYYAILLFLVVILIILSLILYPFIWRD